MSGFRRSRYSLLKIQGAGFTKTGSRILQISIIVVFLFFFFVFVFFRPDTIFDKEENNICSRN